MSASAADLVRPLPGSMQNVKDEDGIFADGVANDVRRTTDDQLARPFGSSDAPGVRKSGQPFHLGFDFVPEDKGGPRIFGGYVIDNGFEVRLVGGGPD
jgi:hypothetical protein